jgi:hypothetical protein
MEGNTQRVNGEKQFDLRNEVLPDYSFYMVNRKAEIIGMESFMKLFQKVQGEYQPRLNSMAFRMNPSSFTMSFLSQPRFLTVKTKIKIGKVPSHL